MVAGSPIEIWTVDDDGDGGGVSPASEAVVRRGCKGRRRTRRAEQKPEESEFDPSLKLWRNPPSRSGRDTCFSAKK